ncbi:class I SAM-dependent methyltransferase [Tissierella sp.]|uniref:class I SAM-dependent methyltransferase n=1 Tax=Tissierella sp. TaxID=41274 RepID=UPI0028A82227|nr:class I SAM-dependent methyltransferase [Tissierella sp.]
MKYMDISKKIYEKKYKDGYGINFPESHVIRMFNYLDRKFSLKGKNINILDFGCGTGTHSLLFENQGWNAYGIDISEAAIQVCKSHLNKHNFIVIEPGESISKIFENKFDIIFANQSLYYLTNEALNSLLKEMNEMLTTEGLVVFTMMGSKNYYYNNIDHNISSQDGIYKVALGGRLEGEAYVNFINSKDELVEKFNIFEEVLTGYYDFYMKEGSSFHYYFIGKKR